MGATGAAGAGANVGAQLLHLRPPLPPTTATTATPASERLIERPGSDFMLDVIRTLDVDNIRTNPGSSFRSLHESLVNYGGNKTPELLTCLHEESAVAMAHGYAKAAGKPMGVMLHGTVGLQHAAMAIYNAWCDRVPGQHQDVAVRHISRLRLQEVRDSLSRPSPVPVQPQIRSARNPGSLGSGRLSGHAVPTFQSSCG